MLNPAMLIAHDAERQRILAALEVLAREIYLFRLDGQTVRGPDTIAGGYAFKFEVDEAVAPSKGYAGRPARVEVHFYISGERGYSDETSITLPMTYLEPTPEGADPVWLKPETEARDAARADRAAKAEAARQAQEVKDRAALEELKKRFPDA